MTYDVSAVRNQLVTAGYRILHNRGKVPVIDQYNVPAKVEALLKPRKGSVGDSFARRFPQATSTGLLICDGLVVLDIDVDDEVMVRNALGEIDQIAPEVGDRAPTRYGGGEHKIALFCRLNGEPFRRLATHRYSKPGVDGDHMIEVLGGKLTASGNYSRQFGIYGPHSFDDAGNVICTYDWDESRPALHTVRLVDLPMISVSQINAILQRFEQMAEAAGWKRGEAPAGEGNAEVFDSIKHV